MSVPIVMPKLGLTMTEGVVTEWLVKPGDDVREGDILFIVETDKIANEIAASCAGVIGEISIAAGSTALVGDVVATIVPLVDAAAVAEETEVCNAVSRSAAPAEAPVLPDRDGFAPRIIATPLARRLARQRSIDLASVKGSGPRGRVMAADVSAAVAEAEVYIPAGSTDNLATIGLTPNQRTTARRLTEAKRDIPHFYVSIEVDTLELTELRTALNRSGSSPKISVNHFILAAVVRALALHPTMNRVWHEEQLLMLPAIDVGMAVETDNGLVAPVLHDLGNLHLDAIAEIAGDLIARSKQGKLRRDDLVGAAISVSNVGMLGARSLIPIINPGQSAILGVGASRSVYRPSAEGLPELREELILNLACDHRVVNGGDAARFLVDVKRQLEAPLNLLRRPSQKDR